MMVRLFRVSVPSSVLALMISETFLLTACYVIATYFTMQVDAGLYLIEDNGLARIVLVVLLLQIGLYLSDLYDNYRARSRIVLIQQCCLVMGGAFLAQALLSYGRLNVILPKWLMVYGSGLALITVPLWRVLYTGVVWKAVGAQKLLFIGSSLAIKDLLARLQARPELGFAAIGFLDTDANTDLELSGVSYLGGVDRLVDVVRAQKPDRIIVGLAESRQRLPVQALLDLRFEGLQIQEAASMYEAVFGRISTKDLRPSHLIFSEEMGPRPGYVSIQNVYSFLFAILGTIVSLPIMAVVAILVKISTPGPALYSQTRVGLRGKHFKVYKFRSMFVDAEARTGAVWASRHDPRVTPVGRWLRKLRLDELPQFFNVLRGDMAMVGPRPERPEFTSVLEEKIAFYRQRHAVKPGITGWAQINHRYGDTMEDTVIKLEYDLYYIKNLAPALDLYIIFHTMKVMLLSRGSQ
jgi:exopolysaccharide biosynthesis polyprenyl glycosylphosphotransferase